MTQPNVSLPYRTPRERATARLKQDAIETAIALGIVLLGLLLAFLQVGDFTANALRAFGVATATAAIKGAITFLVHLQRATADDGALSQ